MDEIIDRKALLDHLDLCLAESDGNTPITDAVIVAIKSAVEQMPAVDAVKVVRCKDCKWCHTGYCERYDDLIPFGRIDEDWDNWYCAEGERRTDGN